MADIHENCGVAAAALLSPEGSEDGRRIPRALFEMLLHLQHRGQLSAGMTTYDPSRRRTLQTHRALGMVSQVFGGHRAEEIISGLAGRCGIAHTRYATAGSDDVDAAQPMERPHGRRWKWFAIAFNGTIANFVKLKRELAESHNYQLIYDNDTEVLMHYIAYGLRGARAKPIEDVFRQLAPRLDGAYCVAFVNAEGEVAVARDPMGFRPMCHATDGQLWAAASESVALTNLRLNSIQSLEPGTIAVVRDGEVQISRFADSPRRAHCFFEYVYFANAGSVLNDRSVYAARRELGRELARIETEKVDENSIVVGVPDAATAAASEMAYALGIPCPEGLLRNRYVGRTFIEGENRYTKALRKYTPLREVLEGKKIFLVEDSIVRLTTLRAILKQIRERGGAREIHMRITCPPIIGPCFYGVDMSTVGELYACRFLDRPACGRLPAVTQAMMASDMGADSLTYLPVESIPPCIGLPREELCMACVDHAYPTAWGRRLHRTAVDVHKGGSACGRTFDSV